MKTFLVIVSILALGLGFLACNNDITSPAPTSTVGYTLFHSEKYDIDVQLPSGWAAAEGPGDLGIIHQVGLVSFNSWGEAGFWAQATREIMPDGSISLHYSAHIVASQIPAGGAYVALEELLGPPAVDQQETEYMLNDLSGLYEAHDWRQDNYGSYADAYFKTFFIGGSSLALEVACSQNATDETVAQINDLLQSWRFNSLPIDSLGVVSTPYHHEPVKVVSIKGPVPPFVPAGPEIEITIRNISKESIVNLEATIELGRTFVFSFDVSQSNPLLPDEIRSESRVLIGGGISDDVSYAVMITGKFQSGDTFTYTKQVQIIKP